MSPINWQNRPVKKFLQARWENAQLLKAQLLQISLSSSLQALKRRVLQRSDSLSVAETRSQAPAELPGQAWVEHEQAKALVEQQQWQPAVESCQRAIALDSTCAWFYKTLSDAYVGQALWKKAVTASQTGISLSPENAWLYHTLGKAYMGQDQWQRAIQAFQQAIALDASPSWFHYSLGEALFKSGQWAASTMPLQTAIQLNPGFPWSYYYLGEARVAQDQIAAAVEVYQQVVNEHPEIAYLRSCLDYALHLQTQEQRIQAYCEQCAEKTGAQETPNQKAQNPDRLRILMLTPYPTYPPKAGAMTRMFYEMETLGKRHELVVLSFIFLKEDYPLEAALAPYCELGIMVMNGDAPPRQPQQPRLIHRYSSERMRKLLRLLQSVHFDVFLCDFIYMAQYRDWFPNAYAVLSEHNIESMLLKRCAAVNPNNAQMEQLAQQTAAVKAFVESDTETALLAAFEDEYWQKFNLRWVVSRQDRQALEQRCRVGQTQVVNNGIDTAKTALLEPHPEEDRCHPVILFIGTMSYYPNIDGVSYFVEHILPQVWQSQPQVSFWIAGADPPPMISNLAEDPRITVIANPEEMSDVAKACQITVVPLRMGGGTRIKILHSMAMGLPVVSTALGSEGLEVEDGVHLLVRDQPQAFAEAILELLSDLDLQQKLRQNGRTLVEQKYDWTSIFQAAEQTLVERYQRWKSELQSQ